MTPNLWRHVFHVPIRLGTFETCRHKEPPVVSESGEALQSSAMNGERRARVGLGHDSHRLGEGRPLILGGVRIEHARGLIGHSDADVVLHAVTDALLGAAGLGDIGDAFPDSDPAYRGCDSRVFLDATLLRLDQAGWRLVNVDVTIFAQEPKLGPLKDTIRGNLARLLRLDHDAVNIKAKTGEGVGHIGRAEAIACHAVALIQTKEQDP
jgi:2-C-methyl-D-erythritol 2,4-cyclodiphosphate synthase